MERPGRWNLSRPTRVPIRSSREFPHMADESDGFLRVTFRGGRFDRHSVPVDVLAELVTLQQALFELASAEFKRRHAERTHLPRGFAESARLYLTETERNCFTASMDRNAAPTLPGLDPEAIDIVIWARGTMLEAFEGRLAPTVGRRELKALARVGDRLGAGEAMELRVRPSASPSRVNHTSRARIATTLHEPLEQVTDLEGEVEGVEDRRSIFALKLSDRRTVSVPFERAEKADVVEALDRRPVTRVRVRGRVQWSTSPSCSR